MPEFARGVAVAYCSAPGPLETAEVPTFYSISPAPAGWSPERVESFYREYNNYLVRNLTVHEAMPGHVLRRLQRGGRDRAGPPCGYADRGVARRDAGARIPAAPAPPDPAGLLTP